MLSCEAQPRRHSFALTKKGAFNPIIPFALLHPRELLVVRLALGQRT
jgi:hypothetical protein